MEKVNLNKALAIGGITLGVSIIGYVAYKYLFARTAAVDISKLSPEELIHHYLIQDIKAMGTVQLNGQYLIPFESFIDMFKVIRLYAKQKLETEVSVKKAERREVLKKEMQLSPEYREIVIEQTAIEERVYEEISQIVLSELGLTQEAFQRTQEVYMTQQQYQNRFFAAVQKEGVAKQELAKTELPPANPILSDVEKVKEMFIFTETVKMESMTAMKLQMQSNMMGNFAIEAMVQQAYMADQLFVKYGVEENDLMKAVVALGVQKDPEVLKLLQENLQKLPPQVMQELAGEIVGCGHGCAHDHGAEGVHQV